VGLRLVLAAEGQRGLGRPHTDPTALVITDLDRPVLDGWPTIQWLNGRPQTRAIPMMALTAKPTQWDRDAAHEARVDFFWTSWLTPECCAPCSTTCCSSPLGDERPAGLAYTQAMNRFSGLC